MTAPADNTSLPGSDSNEVTVLRTAVPAPASPPDAERITEPETAPAVPPQPKLPDLAAEARQRRAERQSRNLLIERKSQLTQRVKHPDGGDSTVEEILEQERSQREQIDEAAAAGSKKHRRLAPWQRSIPKLVLAFDFSLLLYFFAGITNVNWQELVSLALGFAVALAAMVTVLSYGFLSFTGHRLRSHKNDDGSIFHDEADWISIAVFVLALAMIAVLAVLMFSRIRTEVLYALGAQAQLTALIIAAAVSVVNALANFLVIGVHALDGSDQTARLDKLSASVRKPVKRAHELHRRAARQVNRLSPPVHGTRDATHLGSCCVRRQNSIDCQGPPA